MRISETGILVAMSGQYGFINISSTRILVLFWLLNFLNFLLIVYIYKNVNLSEGEPTLILALL